MWHEALGWADLPAAEALRCYAGTTDLVSAFATAATTEAAAEKELAYQTLLDWAVRTRTTVGEFVARMDALRRSCERYEAGGDAVLLSSIHQVKGREFPLVIVTGWEDGLFPSRRSSAEEERRLAYVAMTRHRGGRGHPAVRGRFGALRRGHPVPAAAVSGPGARLCPPSPATRRRMSGCALRFVPLSADHDRSTFASGSEPLDNYFRHARRRLGPGRALRDRGPCHVRGRQGRDCIDVLPSPRIYPAA
jgi:superfamily I DNA/RNA helicase